MTEEPQTENVAKAEQASRDMTQGPREEIAGTALLRRQANLITAQTEFLKVAHLFGTDDYWNAQTMYLRAQTDLILTMQTVMRQAGLL